MKKVILVMTVLFVLATALSTFGVDSANLTGLPDWANIMNNPAGGGQSKSVRFTSDGTFTVPQGVTLIWVTAWGGGGGGGGGGYVSSNSVSGGGGGGGAILLKYPLTVTPGQILTITIGNGGTGGTGVYGNGSNGGDTIVGPLVISGGKGGFGGDYSPFAGCPAGGGDGGNHPRSGGNNYYDSSGNLGTSGLDARFTGGYHIAGAGGGVGGRNSGGCNRFGKGGNFGWFTGGIPGPQYGGGGGAGFAGNGGNGGTNYNGQSAAPNSGAGGGGGGFPPSSWASTTGGNGGSGGVIIEWIE